MNSATIGCCWLADEPGPSRASHPPRDAGAADVVEELGARQPVAGLGVWRVANRPVFAGREPTRVNPLLLADHPRPELVRRQASTATAERHRARGDVQPQAVRGWVSGGDRHNLGQVIRSAPAEERVREALGVRSDRLDAHARLGPTARLLMRAGWRRALGAEHIWILARSAIPVRDDPRDLDRDLRVRDGGASAPALTPLELRGDGRSGPDRPWGTGSGPSYGALVPLAFVRGR